MPPPAYGRLSLLRCGGYLVKTLPVIFGRCVLACAAAQSRQGGLWAFVSYCLFRAAARYITFAAAGSRAPRAPMGAFVALRADFAAVASALRQGLRSSLGWPRAPLLAFPAPFGRARRRCAGLRESGSRGLCPLLFCRLRAASNQRRLVTTCPSTARGGNGRPPRQAAAGSTLWSVMAALPLFPPVAICQPPPSLGVGAQGQGCGTGRRAVRGALPCSQSVALILRPAPFLRPSALCSPRAVLRVGYAAATPLFAGLLRPARRVTSCVSNDNAVEG